MQNEQKYTDADWEVVARYISDEMSDDEKTTFENTLHKDEKFGDMLQQVQDDQKAITDFHLNQTAFDTQNAWNNVFNRISNNESEINPRAGKIRKLTMVWRVAAAFLLLLGVGAVITYQLSKVETGIIVLEAIDQTESVLLSDGSAVTLKRGSTLSFPEQFEAGLRKVELKGEAFFDITRNEEAPFIIESGEAEVRVLGTTFNVQTNTEGTEVFVESGKVRLSALKQPEKQVTLVKGEMGQLQDNNVFKTEAIDKNYLSWKTQKMIFENSPLTTVIKVLEKTYDVNITLPVLADPEWRFTSTFDNEPLDIPLESLSVAYNMEFRKNGRTVVFKIK